jgi:hypothetical protein
MDPLIPTRETFLAKPKRVSRIWPLLTVIALLSCSTLYYYWQFSQITSGVAIEERDQQIQALRNQVTTLTTQQQNDAATIQRTNEKLTSVNLELESNQKKLDAKQAEFEQVSKQLSEIQGKLTAQQQQLSTSATELERLRNRPPLFSFKADANVENLEQKQQDVKEIITNAYDAIQEIYGAPYALNQITISFVSSLSISSAAGEIQISNGPQGISITIRLKDFDKNNFQDVNTIIHETIHGFHGIAVLESSAFEEGMTIAATDAVMQELTKRGVIPDYGRLYISMSANSYARANSELTVKANNDQFYADPSIARIYQMIGYAWYQLYRTDVGVFKKINNAYYARAQRGEKITDAMITGIIKETVPTVNGLPIATFLAEQRAFNPS